MLNLKNALNTTESTIIISSGLSTDQSTPRALRRYLSLKSLDTRDVIVNQFRLAFALDSKLDMEADPNVTVRFGSSIARKATLDHCIRIYERHTMLHRMPRYSIGCSAAFYSMKAR